MAGGSAKFLNPVTLFYTGHSIWTSTATFKSSCTVDVSSWPFDKQNCSLLFGSLSQGKDELVIIGGDIKHRGGMNLFYNIYIYLYMRIEGCCRIPHDELPVGGSQKDTFKSSCLVEKLHVE